MDTFFEHIAEQAEKSPTAIAIASPGRPPLNYQQLIATLKGGINVLHSYGLGRNDRVAIVLPNSPEMATACLMSAITTSCAPLNPEYTNEDFEFFFSTLDIKLLITEENLQSAASSIAKQLSIPILLLCSSTDNAAGLITFNDKAITSTCPDISQKSSDIAFVLHTSGSTDRPKIVALSQENILSSSINLANSLQLRKHDKCLHMLPLFHIGALVDLLIAPLSTGGSVLITTSISSEVFFSCLENHHPSWYQAVPSMLRDICERASKHDRTVFDCLRFIRSVSAPLPTELLEELESISATPIIEIYGMTEAAGVITSNPLPPSERRKSSVGLSAGPEIVIANTDGNPARTGERGEVLIRGSSVISAYASELETHHEAFIGRWLRTGDEAYIDQDGYLFLTGRIKEIINRGGEKISPQEVDSVAQGHPLVAEAATFAIPHQTLGEEVAIAIVTNDINIEFREAELLEYFSSKLAYFKVPRKIFFVSSLPKGGSGKLMRFALADQLNGISTASNRPAFSPPESKMEKIIARSWKQALAIDAIGQQDNFFELGGDSLNAATFIHELEQSLNIRISAAALYDAPTVAEFSRKLEQLASAKHHSDQNSMILTDKLYRETARHISAWPGKRASEKSLLVACNTLGTRPAWFWCLNDMSSYKALAKSLNREQPVYCMRSLLKSDIRSHDNNLLLARHYLDEMLQAQSDGPYILLGACEGGKIAFEMARLLRQQNREVSLLVLQDQFVAQNYDGRVALFFSQWSRGQLQQFNQAEFSWRKFYRGVSTHTINNWDHRQYWRKPYIQKYLEQINHQVELALMAEAPTTPSQEFSHLQILPPEAYRASIKAEPPTLMQPGQQQLLCVEVTNLSNIDWQATETSGITLGNQWLNKNGQRLQWLDGTTSLEQPLAAGKTVKLKLPITAPKLRSGQWKLDIDLVDEGVCRFQNRGSTPSRTIIDIRQHDANKSLKQQLPERARQVTIKTPAIMLMEPGEEKNLIVCVKNTSTVTWQATRDSGISLCNQWLNFDNKIVISFDGVSELQEPLAPGKSLNLTLPIKAPKNRLGLWRLKIDMLDENQITFIKPQGVSKSFRVYIKRYKFWKNLFKKNSKELEHV